MADHTASVVLQLPHYGGPRNVLRRSDGPRRISALAWKAVHGAVGALAAPAELPAAVYCECRRLDDCRDRSPAVARLRADPPVGGLVETHPRRPKPVQTARFPWDVF